MMKLKQLSAILLALTLSTVGWAHEQSSTGEYLSDTSITTKVKSDFVADKDISSLSIKVTTTDGVVTLQGKVNNAAEKKKAADIASHVKGVKSVKDHLHVVKTAKSS